MWRSIQALFLNTVVEAFDTGLIVVVPDRCCSGVRC